MSSYIEPYDEFNGELLHVAPIQPWMNWRYIYDQLNATAHCRVSTVNIRQGKKGLYAIVCILDCDPYLADFLREKRAFVGLASFDPRTQMKSYWKIGQYKTPVSRSETRPSETRPSETRPSKPRNDRPRHDRPRHDRPRSSKPIYCDARRNEPKCSETKHDRPSSPSQLKHADADETSSDKEVRSPSPQTTNDLAKTLLDTLHLESEPVIEKEDVQEHEESQYSDNRSHNNSPVYDVDQPQEEIVEFFYDPALFVAKPRSKRMLIKNPKRNVNTP